VSAAADGTGRGGGAVGGGALAEVTGAVVAVELGVVDGPDMASDTRLSGPDLRRK